MDAIRSSLKKRMATRPAGAPRSAPLNQATGVEYVSGDLCRSVFDKGRKMSPIERIEAFGSAVLLLGIIDVDLTSPGSDAGSLFCTVVPLNASGFPIEREKKMTKAATVRNSYASFDEVFAFGRLCDLDSIHSLKIKIRRYASAFKSERVGVCTISVSEGLEDAPGSHEGLWSADAVCNLAPASGAVRLSLLRHKAPTEPQPAAVVVRVVEGSGLLPFNAASVPPDVTLTYAVRVRAVLYGEGDGAASSDGAGEDAGAHALSTTWRSGSNPQWQADKQLVLHSPGYDAAAIAATAAGEALPEPTRGSRAESLLDDILVSGASFDGSAAPREPPAPGTKSQPPPPPRLPARPVSGSFDGATGPAESSTPTAARKRPSMIPTMLNEFFARKQAVMSSGPAGPPGSSPEGATAQESSPSSTADEARRGRRPSVTPTLFSRLQADLQELMLARKSQQLPLGGGAATAASATAPKAASGLRQVDASRTRLACDMARVRSLDFSVVRRTPQGDAGASGEELCGRVVVPLSSLWGDEDSVVSQHELCIDRWFRLGSGAEDEDGDAALNAGHLRVHLRLKCREQLLPPGWVEAFDCATGASYYFNTVTCASQWNEPAAILLSRTGRGGAGNGQGQGPALQPAPQAVASASMAEGRAVATSTASDDAAAAAGSTDAGEPQLASESPAASRRSRVERMTQASSPPQQLLQQAQHQLVASSPPTNPPVEPCGEVASAPQASPPDVEPTATADGATSAVSLQLEPEEAVSPQPPPPQPRVNVLRPALPTPASHPLPALQEETEADLLAPATPLFGAATGAGSATAAAAAALAPLADADAAEAPDSSDDEAMPPPEPGSLDDAGMPSPPRRGPDVPEFDNPLAALGPAAALGSADDRAKAFFGQLKSKADVKKLESEAVLQRKLAAMTPEERIAFATEQTNAQRREERKSRMLHTHLAGYSGAKPLGPGHRRASSVLKGTSAAGRGGAGGGAAKR